MYEQLSVVKDWSLQWSNVLKADPVRPHIPDYLRTASNREYYVLHEGIIVNAVLCAAFLCNVPSKEEDLWMPHPPFYPLVCTFYSVWSNKKGSGKKIINETMKYIQWTYGHDKIKMVVTLSPKTEMATNFHLSNGAKHFRENEDSRNFIYPW